MYISAVFSQAETQHFLGANDGGCAPGRGRGTPRWHSRVWPLVAEGFTAAGLSWRGGDKLLARQPQKRMNLPLSSRFLAFPHRSSGDFFGVWARGELAAPEGWSHRVPAAGASPSHGATRSTQPGPTEGTEPSPCATPSPELAGLLLNPALPAGGGCKNGICVGCDEDEHRHEAQHHLVDEHHSKDEHHPEAPSITPRPSTPPWC